ncbi:hypothetical protein ACUXZJ_07115 [Flavobacterium sp. TN-1]
MKLKVLNAQSIFDISVQYMGNVESAIELAILNNLSITDNLKPASEIIKEQSGKEFREVVDYLKKYNQQPATALTADLEKPVNNPTGIGYMIIQQNFKVG